MLGPTRSVRWDDWNILQQYGQAIFAYSGGIQPWMTEAASLPWIYNANGSIYPTANAFYRYNSSSTRRRASGRRTTTTPRRRRSGSSSRRPRLPRRSCSSSPRPSPGRDPAASVSIPFSGASPVVWKWSATLAKWLRFYDTQADTDPAGHQFHATDVVIQIVQDPPGPTTRARPTALTSRASRPGTGNGLRAAQRPRREGNLEPASGYAITKFTFPNGKPMTAPAGQHLVRDRPELGHGELHEIG